jgi:hypothetical protein
MIAAPINDDKRESNAMQHALTAPFRSIQHICVMAGSLLLLGGCTSASSSIAHTTPSTIQTSMTQPAFDLREYFDGPVEAWGQFQKRNGEVVKRFHVEMTGSWQGQQGTLDEHFRYDDGSMERRVWQLTDLGNGQFKGQAADVVGVALGQSNGSMFGWRYTMRLPVGDRTYDVQFDDRMYRHDATHMINRATVRKFGFKVGEVTLFFQKKSLLAISSPHSIALTTEIPQ